MSEDWSHCWENWDLYSLDAILSPGDFRLS